MTNHKIRITRAGSTRNLRLTASKATIENRSYELQIKRLTPWSAFFTLNGSVFKVSCIRVTRLPSGETDTEVLINGSYVKSRISDHRSDLLKSMLQTLPGNGGILEILAPMPGLVSRIERSPGDSVEPGTGILILEAMKMENEIRASTKGVLKEIRVRQGQNVEKNEVLAVVESA